MIGRKTRNNKFELPKFNVLVITVSADGLAPWGARTSAGTLMARKEFLFARPYTYPITVTSEWARWRLKSPAPRLFDQPFVQAQIKENITGDRWIPLTKGQ